MSSKFRRQASLVLNVILAVTVAALALHRLNRASTPSAIQVSAGKMTNETPVFTKQPKLAKLPKLPRYTDIASASDRRRWMIDQLRAMGAPNEVLALVARVDREVEWDSRFEACRGDMNKLEKVQLEKDMSKDAEMRAALGEKDFKEWDTKNMLWEAMSTEVKTTASESEAIYAMKKKLQQLQLDMQKAKLDGTMDDPQIDAAYAQAYSEYNQQMKSLLGDERYAKSQDLDYDFVAGNLRAGLAKGGVNLTDSQFQELFNANQQFDDAQSELDKQYQSDPSSMDYAVQYKALNDARDQEYQSVLGASAFDGLQKSQSPNYSQMKKYETYWGLDDSTIDYVYNTMKQYQNSVFDYQAQARALQAQGENTDAINNNLEQLAAQTQQTLQNYLGQDRFNKLQQNGILQFRQPQPPH